MTALRSFPKNAAGKIDRGALPDAAEALQAISAHTHDYEPAATEDEKKMVEIWEKVLKVQVGVLTPFVAYGGHSLTAVQLCSRVNAAFDRRPDLVFLMSEDCTVRALLGKLSGDRNGSGVGCVMRLSPPQRGLPMSLALDLSIFLELDVVRYKYCSYIFIFGGHSSVMGITNPTRLTVSYRFFRPVF